MGIKRVLAAGMLLLASMAFVPSPSGAASFDESVDWLGGELQTLFRGGKIDIDAFYEQLRESFTPEQANNVMDYLIPLLVKKDEDIDRCRYLFDDLREDLFEDDGTVNESAFNEELTGSIEEDLINAGCDLALIEPGAGDETGVGDIPPAFLPPVDIDLNSNSLAVTGNRFNAGNFAGTLSVQDGAIPGFSPVTVTDADGLGANVNGILTENGAVSSFDISVGDGVVSTGAAALGQVTN